MDGAERNGRRNVSSGGKQVSIGGSHWSRVALLSAGFLLLHSATVRAASVSLPTPPIIPIGRTISLNLTSNTSLQESVEGGLFTLSYDLTKVKATLVGVSNLPGSCSAASSIGQCAGGTSNGLRCSTSADCPGGTCNTTNSVIIAFGCSDPLAGTNTVASVSFQALTAGSSALNISQCLFNEGTPACTTTNGSLTVSTCLLDVDGNGKPANVPTDIVYIARRLLGFTPVPPSFRPNPSIPSDEFIAGNVDAVQSSLDVDASGTVNVATDIVYIARRLLGFTPVPPSFRPNPSIPSDAFIAARVDALCP